MLTQNVAGNVALHLFTSEKRREMDLESLWALGHEHDEKSQEKKDFRNLVQEGELADLLPKAG